MIKKIKMKAYVINKYGKESSLVLAEVPIPQLKDNDILVEVHAAGVNLLDFKISQENSS